MAKPETRVQSFKGLNNVTDPLRLGLGWLAVADNINVTSTGAVERREGYARSLAGAITSAYATQTYDRLFVVDGGALKRIGGDMAAELLLAGLNAAPMHWAELNEQVFFSNGTDAGVIDQFDAVREWAWPTVQAPELAAVTGDLTPGTYRVACTQVLSDGRETGASEPVAIELGEGGALQITNIPQRAGCATRTYVAPAGSTVFQLAAHGAAQALTWNQGPDALGAELTTLGMAPLPVGAARIAAWGGRIYAAQYFPEVKQSAVWFSEPLGFHLFDLSKNFFLVAGEVTHLVAVDAGLIVCTDKQVLAYTGEGLKQLAPYGAPAGWPSAADDDGTVLFWTHRGLCRALPFANLTQRRVSLEPGASAGAAIVWRDGEKRFLVSLQSGGNAFNPRLTT